jgi:hypothetical protein
LDFVAMRNFSGKSVSTISDDHLRAIGAVVVNWSSLEMVMEIMILGLYDVKPNRGLVLTSNLGFQNKLTILRMLANNGAIKDGTEKQNCLDLLKRIEDSAPKRNTIAHGLWGAGNAQGLAKRLSLKVRGRQLSTINEQVPLAEVEAIANEFLTLRHELSALAERVGARPEIPNPE